MSMTYESSQYFSKVARQWDSMRSGYFTESVREAAIAKAYLHPEMDVADVGAGTGFMTAGLAPLVRQVHVVDGSAQMLEVARENLQAFGNLVFHQADGTALPLPDASVDAVFANMYLHHVPDPPAAIREMKRVLRPGGRLVITDMDAHDYAWMREEMADVWLGFSSQQIYDWFQEAGLVNLIVDCTDQSCCAETQNPEQIEEAKRQAKISVFVAVGAQPVSGVHESVQEHYGELALNSSSCCSGAQAGSCSCSTEELISLESLEDNGLVNQYTPDDRLDAPAEAAEFSLGCGNPVAIANLRPGETVLDIGSGGGFDSFLAAKKVGPMGKVIGVDMTPPMLERARRSAERAGLANVEFRWGQAEALPVMDESVDVIISNCVINLCADKGAVFKEAARVLRTGGRLEVSDVVTSGSFPAEFRSDPLNWGSCIFGALPETEYTDLIAQAGFGEIQVRRSASAGAANGVKVYSAIVSARKV